MPGNRKPGPARAYPEPRQTLDFCIPPTPCGRIRDGPSPTAPCRVPCHAPQARKFAVRSATARIRPEMWSCFFDQLDLQADKIPLVLGVGDPFRSGSSARGHIRHPSSPFLGRAVYHILHRTHSMREPKAEDAGTVMSTAWDDAWHVGPLPRPPLEVAGFRDLRDAPGDPPPVGPTQHHPLFPDNAGVFLRAR